MRTGSRQITSCWTRRAVGIAFCGTFLLASASGVSPWTAIARSSIASAVLWIALPTILSPVVDTLVDAIARDRLAAAAEHDEESPK